MPPQFVKMVTFLVVLIIGFLYDVECNGVACPGVLPGNLFKHDFGGNKINVSCSYNFNVHNDNDGLILIAFRTLKLLSGDSFVIQSNGSTIFGPFNEGDYPTTVIVPVPAMVTLTLNPHHSGHPRTFQGYFSSKRPYIYRINSLVEEGELRSPLYNLNVKNVEVEYRVNIKLRASRSKNFTVWFEGITENMGSEQLQLKRLGLKDLKAVDPTEDYFVGNSFGVVFKLKSEFPNEKLTVKFRPIVGDCSQEIFYLNSSQTFKPHPRLGAKDSSKLPFECLLIVRSAESALRAKIEKLDLNGDLKLLIKIGASINSPNATIQTTRKFRSVKSDTGKLLLSLSGTRPIPQFDVQLDCASCDQSPRVTNPQSIRSRDEPKRASVSWILCGTLGGSAIVAIVILFGLRLHRKRAHRRSIVYIPSEIEIFSRTN